MFNLFLALALTLSPSPLLELRLMPRVCLQPCTVRISLRVEPQVENRKVVVTLDGENYFGSTELPLEGEHAPAIQPPYGFLWFKDLPAGEYEVVASLQSSTGVLERRRTMVSVKGIE